MKKHAIPPPIPARQKGAALILALVVLLVLTLIALSAARSSMLEALMSTNTQFSVASLSDAELAIKEGEDDIEAITSDAPSLIFETEGDHYFLSGTTPEYKEIAAGSYGIEYAGPRPVPGESGEMGATTAGSFAYVFLVHAQDETGKGAWREVETVFFTDEAP